MPDKPQKRICAAVTRAGRACRRRALAGSDLCFGHAGVTRPEGRRCTATTKKDGKRCASWTVAGRDLCANHAGILTVSETLCTALDSKGQPCRAAAILGSEPPLCVGHLSAARKRAERPYARPGTREDVRQLEWKVTGRRCTAIKKNGARCGGWAMRASPEALCSKHAGLRPLAERQCTALRKDGARCANNGMRGSKAAFGRPLCNLHAPSEARRARVVRYPPEAKRRCRARKPDGKRCGAYRVAGSTLCYAHTFPNRHHSLKHGYFRRQPYLPQAVQDHILALSEEPLAAEMALLRLKLADVNAYLARGDLSVVEREQATRYLFRGVGALSRLSQARHTLTKSSAADVWEGDARGEGLDAMQYRDPRKTGHVHQVLDGMKRPHWRREDDDDENE